MSYEIVYAREFIKTGDERIIPLVLAGSNNCWSYTFNGRSRRERHWFPFLAKQGENPAFYPEDLMKRVQTYIPSEYQEHFIRNGKWVRDDGFVRFFVNGIKRAKRLEELHKELIWQETLEGTVYYYDKKLDPQTIHSAFIRSTCDLDAFLKNVDELIEENKDNHRLYIGLCFSGNDALQRDKETKPKRKKASEFYVVTTGRGYVSKLTRRGVYHTCSSEFAKQFDTQKQAEIWVKDRKLERRFPKLNFGIEYVA